MEKGVQENQQIETTFWNENELIEHDFRIGSFFVILKIKSLFICWHNDTNKLYVPTWLVHTLKW